MSGIMLATLHVLSVIILKLSVIYIKKRGGREIRGKHKTFETRQGFISLENNNS